jgi:CheY-like chemotaxis protein/hemerythrin-like domain-containing protein
MTMRHPSLISLSRDHHHGLALALRLCQGETALLADGWTHDTGDQVLRVLQSFREELSPHFASEEEVLFPALRAALPEQRDLIERLLRDHRALAAKIIALPMIPATERRTALAEIGRLLQDHIRTEERILFPACEAGCAPNVLAELGERLARSRENAGKPPERVGPRRVVLLVEDELELRNLFALMLEAEGLEVLQAADGLEAMRLLDERGEAIHLVVTDMNLPGPDGTLIVSHAHRVIPAAKILAMSGYGGPDMRRAASEAGADEFMNKPFDPPRAVKTVKRLLEMR